MEAEIKAIIQKNLPAEVGTILKERLEQAEEDAANLEQTREQLKNRDRHVANLESVIEDYKKFDQRNATLEEREKAVSQSERDLKVATLEYQLAAEKDKTAFSQSVTLGLVRNTEYKSVVFDSKSGPDGRDQYGNPLYATHTVNSSETKKAE